MLHYRVIWQAWEGIDVNQTAVAGDAEEAVTGEENIGRGMGDDGMDQGFEKANDPVDEGVGRDGDSMGGGGSDARHEKTKRKDKKKKSKGSHRHKRGEKRLWWKRLL